jgi:transposase
MTSHFKTFDRETAYLLPPSVEDWLPESHLARFVVEIVAHLDLTTLKRQYAGRGSEAFHPEMLLSLLFYGYATGVFSSRKLEQATHDSVAFRYIAANTHPDHDTIANFRKRFLEDLKPLFLQILLLAQTMGLLKLGKVSLDGTKIKANASKHRALSYGHAHKLEQQLKEEVQQLLSLAEAADQKEVSDGLDIPLELERRQERLKAIAEAKAKLEARAAERQKAEQEAYQQKLAEREARQRESGKKPRGKDPQPPQLSIQDKDQINLTDEESRIMPTSGGGFQQSYNAQAAVDAESLLIVSEHVTNHVNDKQEVQPCLTQLQQLPESLRTVTSLLCDAGYYSDANVENSVAHTITPYIAVGRQAHHPPLAERYATVPPLSADSSEVEKMKHRLKTPEGRALYAKRKATIETVFGIIKSVLGFRQFLLRGLKAVSGEWTLVSMAWNLKRLFQLQQMANA